jgi:hypothetical protein
MAIPYELEVLDELISETIHPKQLFNENSVTTSKQFAAWERFAALQVAKARKRLKPITYGFLKEKHKKLYILQHQSATIHLLDTLFHYLGPGEYKELAEKETDSRIEKLYKRLLGHCNFFLSYIQDTFSGYWNDEQKISEIELMKVQESLLVRLPGIKRKLSRISTDKKLVTLFVKLLEPVSDKTNVIDLTYSDLAYINDLVVNLENLKPVSKLDDSCLPLNVLIIYLNLNQTDFKDYLSDFICTAVNQVSTVKEKLDKLFFYYKKISQMHIKPNVALVRQSRSVKDEMKDWLAGEIKYLQKTQNLGIIVPARFKSNIEYKRGIWCTYTVEEIALLHRLQHEAGFITNKKVRPMIEDLSKFVHTVSVHNISPKNLYNSFYNIDSTTIQSLNDKLFTLVNQLRKLESQLKRKAKEKQTLRKPN